MLAYAAPAAPILPIGAITGALIIASFATIALIGVKYGYEYSLGALLKVLADATRDIRWIGGKIASTFERIDSLILQALGEGIEALEGTTALLWDALGVVVRETGDAMVAFGQDVYDTLDGVVSAVIPIRVRAATAPIDRRLDGVNKRTTEQARAEAIARSRGIDEVNRDLTREALARERGIDDIRTFINTHVIPRIRAGDQALADVIGFTRRNLASRIRTLEKALAAGALGAVAIAAVTRVFPYWQCTNVRGFNRALCRSPIGSLDWLFGLASLVVVALDVEEIAGLGQELADMLGGVWAEMTD